MDDSKFDPLAARAADLLAMEPAFVGNIRLYPASDGGRTSSIRPGWGCPCKEFQDAENAWDAWPVLDRPLAPGEARLGVPFVTLTREGAKALASRDQLYLWEGRLIGEVHITSRN